jgi:glycosyltransferase involved in cell wall biosynthesis
VLKRSTLYLRTPITDGVASSVLESIALGVPVVACENGSRPEGALTYRADDPFEMADRMEYVLAHRQQVVEALGRVDMSDTVADEIALLTERA